MLCASIRSSFLSHNFVFFLIYTQTHNEMCRKKMNEKQTIHNTNETNNVQQGEKKPLIWHI